MKFFKSIMYIAMMMCLFAIPQMNHAAPLVFDKSEAFDAPLKCGYIEVVVQYQTIGVDLPFVPQKSAVTIRILNEEGIAIYRHRTNSNLAVIPDWALESGNGFSIVVIQAGAIIIAEPIKG